MLSLPPRGSALKHAKAVQQLILCSKTYRALNLGFWMSLGAVVSNVLFFFFFNSNTYCTLLPVELVSQEFSWFLLGFQKKLETVQWITNITVEITVLRAYSKVGISLNFGVR